MTLDTRFADAMGQLLGPDFPSAIALAVSGGGDSMAMLALAHNWARVWGVALHVATVDHGLREGSAAEAAMVAKECAALGHSHATLRWHWDGTGNLQDAARRGRLDVINAWRGEITHVLMAHTQDDLAETFLMRLARGSGVEGLAAMQATHHTSQGVDVIRPCLQMTRAELRHYLTTLKMPWAEDPSNDDPRFDRVRFRQARAQLDDLGLDVATLAATATRMTRARAALKARAVAIYEHVKGHDLLGCVTFCRDPFATIERDTQLRLLAAALMWIGQADYRPRADALDDLLERLLGGGAGTLAGVKAQVTAVEIILFREYAAVQNSRIQGNVWDGRWAIEGPPGSYPTIGALGEAITQCPDWRATGQPRAALMASPAMWRGDTLIAAPVAQPHPDWHAQIDADFRNFLLCH